MSWAPAMNRWHDQTGVAHYLVTDDGIARPLCGANPFTLGGGFQRAADAGAYECRRCAKALAKITTNHGVRDHG